LEPPVGSRICAGGVLYSVRLGSGLASAQDAVVVDPQHHKVEFETEQVRVLRITFPPGEQSVMHSHPCAIAIGLTDSTLTFHLPDGHHRFPECGE